MPISLRAATVRQAQQALSGTIVVLLLCPLIAIRLIPPAWGRSILANAPTTWQLMAIGLGVLLVFDVSAVALAMHRFQRSRLIAPVWTDSPSTAQTVTCTTPRDT